MDTKQQQQPPITALPTEDEDLEKTEPPQVTFVIPDSFVCQISPPLLTGAFADDDNEIMMIIIFDGCGFQYSEMMDAAFQAKAI